MNNNTLQIKENAANHFVAREAYFSLAYFFAVLTEEMSILLMGPQSCKRALHDHR